jgi:hypothetical protein
MSADEKPKSYEECQKEIEDLRKDPEYDDWKSRAVPNKGLELQPDMFRMTPEERKGWADLASRLFSRR